QGRRMYEAARTAGVVHYVNHNYRRCPAVVLARQLIDQGKVGRIFHWRGAYLQSWIIDPSFPLTWHLRKETAGAGPHYDLNSHSVDLAHFLVGDIAAVTALTTRFVPERPLDLAVGGAFDASSTTSEKGAVTVDDAAFMLAEFAGGALGSFESSRFATGRKNYNRFEIYGDRGSLAFNLERMNELEYCSLADEPHAQGFRTIQVTEAIHPYVAHWWPPGHIIGYEHTFIHAFVDFLDAITKGVPIHPDFADGLKIMQVLEGGLQSAATGRKVALPATGAAGTMEH
ncbi:MAG: Gfo/Idh/MocA family oxidoreductase, partial [Acidobacteria bacterium]|nr:Gfo/Idh/MocA family oxidoreductase [Acidobacteriota bacterium]